MRNGEPSLQMVERLLKVLNSFTVATPVLTTAEVREATDLPATTVSRLVNAMTAQGLLISLSNGVALSPRFLRWAEVAKTGWDLPMIAEPYLGKLRDLTEETSALQIPVRQGRLTVASATARRSIAFQVEVGRVLPLHAGSGGKVILAFSDEARPGELVPLTRHTVTDENTLNAELDEIRSKGWAFACGEREEGLNSVSAPIWGAGRVFVGSLTTGGPSYRLNEEGLHEAAAHVVAVAGELSRALGYE